MPTISRESDPYNRNTPTQGYSARNDTQKNYSGNYADYDFDSTDYYEDDLEETTLMAVPKVLPPQVCPRCENEFPGGLERCTACGLAVAKFSEHYAMSLPWKGYDKGLIICQTCGFANPDYLARKNRIQKCDQCGKTVYIPSGLYNKHKAHPPRFKVKRHLPNPIFELVDILGASWNRFMHSKAKWPVLLGSVVLALIGLLAAYLYKEEFSKPPKVISPVVSYYNQILPYETQLSNALDTFNQDSGGGGDVQASDFTKWSVNSLDPTNAGRFTRNADILLKTVEGLIGQTNSVQNVPPEALQFHQNFLQMLTLYQEFYARLKDGISQNNQALWNSGFVLQPELKSQITANTNSYDQLRQLFLSLQKNGQ